VWLSTLDGLNRWNNGRITIYRAGGPGEKEAAHLRESQSSKSVFYNPAQKPAVAEIVDPGLPDDAVGSLYEDARNRLWVSTPKQVARFENGRFTVVREVPSGWVNAITGDANAGIWISYQDHGLVHWVEGKVVETVPWSRLGGNVIASAVTPDPVSGGLWLGFFQGGLVHYKDGQVRASYGKNQGLGKGRVMGIQLDPDGTLWAATEGGLSRLSDGRIITLNSSNGLPCDTVHWTVEVDSSFWLYTACGLVRVSRSELERWSADPARHIDFTLLGRSDGVRSRALLTGYTPRVIKSSDGRIWFANLESLSVIDPRHLVLNSTAPPVHIEEIIADSQSYAPRHGMRLPARVRDLTIYYTALSYAAPQKVRFRFKLEGQDKDWRELVDVRHVQYTNLPPKHYRFRVIATNNSGVWNEQGDTLEFSVDPAYYQTNWFRALCVAAFMALLWAAYRLRVRQLHREFNMAIDARVSERTRIARELHDTLLQSLQALLFQYQAARNLFAAGSERAIRVLDATIDKTEQAIAEGRDAIQDIRSDTVAQNALPELLTMAASELAESQADHALPTFGVTVEGDRRTVAPIIREETYRIALELLRNAFRHANARRIEAEIRYDADVLRLRIRDDGKGMDPKASQENSNGHWGLRGVRERAQRMGAKLDVWSESGAGTEFQLTVPAASAYVGPGDDLPFRLFRKVKRYAYRK
jgi:signal transduction histidine kinase